MESTSAVICGEKISFGVVEKSRQIKSATTSGGYTYNRVALEPTGTLARHRIWNEGQIFCTHVENGRAEPQPIRVNA